MLHLPLAGIGKKLHRLKVVLPRWHRLQPVQYVFGAFLLTAGLWAGDALETHHVTAVRFWSLGDVTRIAVETDGQFVVHSDRLDNPIRLFYDLVGTKPTLGSKAMTLIPVSDKLLRPIRVPQTQRHGTPLVLDLVAMSQATTPRLEEP